MATKAQALIGSLTADVWVAAQSKLLALPMLDDEFVIVQFLGADHRTWKFTQFEEARKYAAASLRSGEVDQIAIITKFALDQKRDVWATDIASLKHDGQVRYRGFIAFT